MSHALDLLLIGGIMLVALAAHSLGQRVHVPRVTLLLLVGALAGPEMLDLIPLSVSHNFSLVTELTLAMVGFLLGERMSFRDLRQGREAIVISLAVTLITALLIFVGIWLVTQNLVAALLLAAIATATDPAATLDVIREAGARGPLTRLVTQVVAIDDAWGAILFSVLLVFAELVSGNGAELIETIGHGFYEVVGAIALGALLGLPMAWLTGRLKPGEPMLLESAGFVFLAAGIAGAIDVSYLLTCMALGVTVANRAHHHIRPFRSIEGIVEPFLAMFFFLAGFSLDWEVLPTLGLIGAVYILVRMIGRVAGGYVGGVLAGSGHKIRVHTGACLLPQAGVAMGLALVATDRMPEMIFILPLVIGSTVLFELLGPPITMKQLRQAGETRKDPR
ncbi:cation:proton antiporter [Marinobacter sp. M216]|uniref:Cation:proton antiporter n=1 Tax=Marinobacter albus TaxID=3030833 RepID=A0ABT7HEX7_9GAMM|nr:MULTISPECIES: cation:proton antiporter [unclassified Marinobacter]MBW7471840.1 cation:proton antiporter [Marinobacter sp. F4218]MDK9558410.1 cation:proton antiporter [Marinobacter sp. M216]